MIHAVRNASGIRKEALEKKKKIEVDLSVLYHRWKKLDRAETLYKQALSLNPGLQSAKDNLALLYKTLVNSGRH
uniref:Uncharacterized protein n=1 Tax=Timema bartmani TaxID=61472 RepID=A0A7R9EW73_9NEOP|nr:unnamed protein product [Timema bartmani]